MARILLPPAPKSRGMLGLCTGLALVGWTAYLLCTYQAPSLFSATKMADVVPAFVEIDLRGPKYDEGRYAGFQQGQENRARGFTAPAAKVRAFQAGEAARALNLDADQSADFLAGFEAGFSQALTAEKTSSPPPQK